MRKSRWLLAFLAYYVIGGFVIFTFISSLVQAPDAANNEWQAHAIGLGVGLVFLPAIFVPSLIAYWRRVQSRGVILFLNFVIGWTGIGWLCLLLWASWSGRAIPVEIYSPTRRAPQ